MSYYYKQYEWTAFSEADLLANSKNGSDFGKGDSFVMGSPTTKMTTYDNDSTLSGGKTDWWCRTWSADQSGQDGYVNNARVGCKIYAEQYHVLKGSDGKTYYLIDMKIEGHDSAGAGNGYFTFYGAKPPHGTSLTVTSTCKVEGSWIDYSCLGAGNTAPPNTPPTFTNVPSNGVFCVNENTKLVVDLNASDKDGDALTFKIVGGQDAAAFEIDAKTGELIFKTAPDYEKPTDSDKNNSYKVIVSVEDGKGGVTNKELTVQVKDVQESTPGKCIVIEAEDMTLCGYTVKSASSASGNEYIALKGWDGYAATKFTGESGEYDFSMRYWDAAKGDGVIKVYVNGKLVESVRLCAENNKWSELKIEDLKLNKGDVIKLVGAGKGCEYAIIDNIKLCPNEPTSPKPGALEGRVFADLNKDGLDNDGANAVAGVTVQLLDAAGNVVATETTGADGGYRFDGLTPGQYRVVFPTEVEGKVLTNANVGNNDTIDSDANTGSGETGNYTVTAGNITKDVDAGIKDPGTAAIEGRVFVDANGDNVDNDEAGVAGVTVKLLDANGNVIATTTTDADGAYLFDGLDAGDYTVEFPKSVNGLTLVNANVGADDTIDSDASQTTGRTGTINLEIGEISSDNDAGVKDPATASIGNFVFLDADQNGRQGANETGVAGVTVTLYNAAGLAIATAVTGASGEYLFSGLTAGTYTVGFTEKAGYDFTTANVGDDALDSDADVTTGMTAPVTLAIGEANLTVDAGLIVEFVNTAPDAKDDVSGTCSNVVKTVDVLANDTDADGHALTITKVAGQAIAEGGSVDVDGVTISLVGGKLVIDGTDAYEDLLIGQKAKVNYSYEITDGNGGSDTANLDFTFCGGKNTLDTIKASLPTGGVLNLAFDTSFDGEFYTVTITGTGDARFDGISFENAYCLSLYEPIGTGVAVPYNFYLAAQGSVPTGVVARPQNLDMVNWILNQDFDAKDNGDGNGQTYTEAEIQGAIWGLTDGYVYVDPAANYGTTANAKEIYNLAMANGEGFVAGEGDIIGLVLDPTAAAEAAGNKQPLIIGVEWDDLAQDCFCF